ncbi:cyclic GMP-AMP synthase isoform X1 [Papilio machaon]|uniref:cyclic GMP-AMP synthase isoform X1 n=1 Tax=Papilio machaon TaxID=76193 RepID=UPI001E662F87|nr:cyclic GMP-AMP synthase isoform X1 [Papilio machaon]
MAFVECVLDRMVSTSAVPVKPVLRDLNDVLADVYVRHIALRKEDCRYYYEIFTQIFYRIHNAMKEVDPYYAKYSSEVKFAGSHFDRLRINKPDEYDMVIVVHVPFNFIQIEPKHPGYVQLRVDTRPGSPRQYTPDSVEVKTAYKWLDSKNYILRSEYANWIKSIIIRAIDRLSRQVQNANKENMYTVRYTETGPALTLIIENDTGFKLDVDLVLALQFSESRWPVEGYNSIPAGCSVGHWMVAPKPNRHGYDIHDENRSWRISLQEQERKLIHDSHNLRLTVKLLKKLRDSKNMSHLASYYIKTLFLWEVTENTDADFWMRNDLATLFKHMLQKLHSALRVHRINYFWNSRYNLIGNLNPNVVESYANIVGNLLQSLNTSESHLSVAKYLLTKAEFESYRRFF